MKLDSGKLRSSRGLHFWWSLNGFVAAAYFGMLPQMLYAQESSSGISLRYATAGSGFDFRYENGSVGQVYVVEVVGDRPGKDAAYLLDSTKARTTLGWQAAISLDQGIDETIAWISRNLEALKHQPADYIHKP